MNNNYTLLHLHSDYSLLDSTTSFERYVDWAVEHGMKAIASTEHGNVYNWTTKKEYCDKKRIKYIHGVELYLTEKLYHDRVKTKQNKDGSYEVTDVKQKIRDNYHIILLAKNMDGVKEINSLVSMANDEDHFYFKPRITFEEASEISDNVIVMSACLASPLWSIQSQRDKLKNEIESYKNDIEHTKEALTLLRLELEGQSTIRKKKRKEEDINRDINRCQDFILAYENNIEYIEDDLLDLDFCVEVYNPYTALVYRYDFFEVQPHVNSESQKEFNKKLIEMSKEFDKKIICGTDTHNFDSYAAECRTILQTAKKIEFLEEDTFDLTLKTYDEVCDMFKRQNVLTDTEVQIALENTNVVVDMCENFELDKTFKYPISKSPAEDAVEFGDRCFERLDKKIADGIITSKRRQEYVDRLNEELAVFKKVGMLGFMLSMSDFIGEARNDGIPFGAARGSAAGSLCAYITDINDVDPMVWNTIFSRFCNENRIEAGDVDIDVFEEDRDEVFSRIIKRIGKDKTAHVFAIGTNKDLGAIDDIGRALSIQWVQKHGKDTKQLKIKKREIQKTVIDKEERKRLVDEINEEIKKIDAFNSKLNNPYSLNAIAKIKDEWKENPELCRKNHPDICYYIDGMNGVKISQSMHPAGIVASPITLADNYGVMYNDGNIVLQLDMDAAHSVGLIKYDVLGLKTIGVIKRAYQYINKKYPRMHEINWNDANVWEDIDENNLCIFQFESNFAGQTLKTMHPTNIFEMNLVNAMIRPSGASYREDLSHRIIKHNPDKRIDKLLESNLGYLVYQEDIIAFLQQICGLSGSDADTVRRGIGQKRKEVIDAWLPKILEGYCDGSDKSRDVAEQEAKEYLKVIEDASSYSFGYNHSLSYCLLGYIMGYLRYYYPEAFICAFMNCANNEEDIQNGTKLATIKGIKIEEPKFRFGQADYSFDTNKHVIYKGMGSIKYLNNKVATQLPSLRNNRYDNFFMLLEDIKKRTSVNSRQLEILIKLDFFREFGNARLLLRYVDMFNKFLSSGTTHMYIQSIGKDTYTGTMKDIIERHSTETDTRYKVTDIHGIFKEIDGLLQSANIKDFPLKDKILDQQEYLGYVSIKTGREEDRPKLFVLSMTAFKAKKGRSAGKIWARSFKTHSIGRGKSGEWMILEDDYQNGYEFNVGDIIEFNPSQMRTKEWGDKKQYWIKDYNLVMD